MTTRLPGACMLLGLFLLIFGAKLWLINDFGNATPFWDEWDSEASIIKASIEHTLSPAQFFEAHNEHRILFTRILWLLLFRANKQWDPILFMVAQAPIHAFAIIAFVCMAGTFMSGAGKVALAGFAALLGVLPFGLVNTLWGFQSQIYFMMLFGFGVIWLCWRNEALSVRWLLGASLAFASLFTMAGSVFSILPVAAFMMVRLLCERGKEWERRLAGIVILAAIAAFGFAMTPRLNASDTMLVNLVAPNFKAFLWALTGILSWPCSSHWACIAIQAPFILLVLATVIQRVPFNDGRWFVIMAGASYWLQVIAIAYKRCIGWDSLRYCDTWVMLLIITASSLCLFRNSSGERWKLFYPIAALWLSVCLYGVLDRAVNLLPGQLMDKRSAMMEREDDVRQYLRTGDTAYLNRDLLWEKPDLPHEDLDTDSIRRVLPANLLNPNPPLSPVNQKSSGGGFVQNGYASQVPPLGKTAIGSYGKSGDPAGSEITLYFKVPRGTRQVDLQVAGNPNARGIALNVQERRRPVYSIAPAIDPGNNWQTISVRLNPKSTSFKISAKDQSKGAWLAFSMPAVSTGGFPGRWARLLANNAFYFLDAGLLLFVFGAFNCMKDVR